VKECVECFSLTAEPNVSAFTEVEAIGLGSPTNSCAVGGAGAKGKGGKLSPHDEHGLSMGGHR
jgi:hypothetical protein